MFARLRDADSRTRMAAGAVLYRTCSTLGPEPTAQNLISPGLDILL